VKSSIEVECCIKSGERFKEERSKETLLIKKEVNVCVAYKEVEGRSRYWYLSEVKLEVSSPRTATIV
jgi:hypothetical protein